jgi:hypothetical protein
MLLVEGVGTMVEVVLLALQILVKGVRTLAQRLVATGVQES